MPADAGDAGLIPGLERYPGAGNGYPFKYSWIIPGESHGLRSGWATSSWVHKESDMTKRLTLSLFMLSIRKKEIEGN